MTACIVSGSRGPLTADSGVVVFSAGAAVIVQPPCCSVVRARVAGCGGRGGAAWPRVGQNASHWSWFCPESVQSCRIALKKLSSRLTQRRSPVVLTARGVDPGARGADDGGMSGGQVARERGPGPGAR
ncbi:hypothetical protein GCM10009714_34570 [Microlunatus capsulatus]